MSGRMGQEDSLDAPRDDAGFTRRACPRCRAHFKVRAGRREERVLAAAMAQRVHALQAGAAAAVPPRHCPYCGERADAEAFWTEEQLRWLEAQARSLAEDVRWWRLRAPFDRVAERPRPTYVPVHPRRRAAPPVREAGDDMTAVPLPCCGEEEKVSRGWVGPVRCHYCGFVHAREMARDIGMELARLRAWMGTPR